MTKNVTKKDIAEAISEESGIPFNSSLNLLRDLLDIVKTEAMSDNSVRICKLGLFTSTVKNSRIGRVPKTGETRIIKKRKLIKVRFSSNIGSANNG